MPLKTPSQFSFLAVNKGVQCWFELCGSLCRGVVAMMICAIG
uniref:Uncharacterized protein MANES_01G214100 n=1 Tax=Rhizophora mucronata TaxID=61149 RepID=A0A2P2NIB5_RHIMU